MVVAALLATVVMLFSCSKEDTSTPLDVEVDNYADLYDYSIWGEIISSVFIKPEAQSLYLSALKNNWSEEQSIPLALLLINDNYSLLPYFKEVIDEHNYKITIDDFMIFLSHNPDLALSLYDPTGRTLDAIQAFDSDFKVAVVPNHDDIQYDFYKDGTLSLQQASDMDPSFMVIVLQKREGFFVLHKDRILEEFERNSLTPYCSGLESEWINYNTYADEERIEVSGDSLTNPLYDLLILKDIDVIVSYNKMCGLQISMQEGRGSTSGAPRGCERDWLDDEENIKRLKIPNGKATLKLFGCKWLTSHCSFRVDVFIPTAHSSNQSYYVNNSTKIITEKRNKLKSKNWVYTKQQVEKWRYLEGLHGDTWQYNWIGIHPKGNGSTTTTNFGFSFSPTVTFKEPISGTEVGFSLGQGLTAMRSVQRKHNDFELGNDVVYYCDFSSANGWQGPTYSTGAVEFSVREGGF